MKRILPTFVVLFSCAVISSGQSHGSLCETNADCNASANLHCLAKNCECLRTHTVDRNKVCKLTYGQPCEVVFDCNLDRKLKCDDETKLCNCQIPEEQIFDGGIRKACVSYVGQKCDMDYGWEASEFTRNCVHGAFCEMREENGGAVHECKCSEGWEQTEEFTCRIRYNK